MTTADESTWCLSIDDERTTEASKNRIETNRNGLNEAENECIFTVIKVDITTRLVSKQISAHKMARMQWPLQSIGSLVVIVTRLTDE